MNVEDEVVNMKFNNEEFQRRAGDTLGMLGRVKEALSLKGAESGIANVQRGFSRFSPSGLLNGVGEVSKGFIAMSAIAITAITRITNAAIDGGVRMVKALSFAPILDGFKEYELNLDSIQTILANTKQDGENLKTIGAALQELNTYSDRTIYNFAQMASNVKTFTAAGIKLDTSVSAIKGLSNVAALFGADATSAARGMYQLSQAMSSGIVRLQDWRSLEMSGLAGQAFRESLIETARVHDIKIDEIIKKSGSFRDSLSEDWLTAQIMTETLSKFTGDLSDEQLRNMGYTKQQVKEIQALAKTANDSATKVKTLSQLMGTLKEASGSGWSQTWAILFGDLKEARSLFTGVNDVLGGWITQSANARNKVLADWDKLGGRTVLIEAISDAFHAILRVIRPIRNAFRDIFPAKSGQDLFDMTERFADFAENLKIGDGTMKDVRRTFAGVFAVIDIGRKILGGAADLFGDLFGAVANDGGLLNFVGNIGDMLVNLNEMLDRTGAVEEFFDDLGNFISTPLKILGLLARALFDITQGLDFSGFDKAGDALGNFAERMSPVEWVAEKAAKAWDVLVEVFQRIGDFLEPFANAFARVFEGLGEGLQEAFSTGNFNSVLQVLNTALLGGALLLIRNFFKKVFGIGFGADGLIGSITGLFGELGETLRVFQDNIRAKTLLTIAGAVALLTLSIIALSGIDKQELGRALTAIGGLMGALVSAFTAISLISTGKGYLRLPFIAAALIGLSFAILALAGAMRIIAGMSWEEISKGLVSIGALLLGISLAVIPISANSGNMIRASIGIIAIAVALNILALAVKQFAKMEWKELAKGLGSAILIMLALAGTMKLMSGTETGALALIAMATAVKILASAVEDFAEMDVKELARGLVAVAVTLGLIAAAMHLMPAHMAIQAVGLLIVSGAMLVLAQALKQMGNLKNVGQSLVVMGLALLMLALGLKAMSGSLSGAAALAIASGSLILIAKALGVIGKMKVSDIAKALLAIAAAFVILGLAGLILAPLAPVILSLAGSLLAIGAALVLAGAGALAFATAFAVFVAAASVGVGVLAGLIQLIPLIVENFVLGVVAFVTTLAENTDKMFLAIGTLIYKFIELLLNIIIKLAPKIAEAVQALVTMLIDILLDNVPRLADAGLKLIVGLLKAMRDNIGDITDVAIDLIARFVKKLGERSGDLAKAALQFIIDFLNGLADAIDEKAEALGRAGGRIAVAIVGGIVAGIDAGLDVVLAAVDRLAAAAAIRFANKFSPIGFDDLIPGMGNDRKATPDREFESDIPKKLMTTLNEMDLTSSLDIQPTITPILDLSLVEQAIPTLKSLIDSAVSSSSVKLASSIGTSGSPLDVSVDAVAAEAPVVKEIDLDFTFTSPKALDEITIYRQTRNTVSQLEEVLRS